MRPIPDLRTALLSGALASSAGIAVVTGFRWLRKRRHSSSLKGKEAAQCAEQVNAILHACKTATTPIDTPALIIDLDALEHNICLVAGACQKHGAIWRPHCKAIRSPALAHKLIAAGAVGITCAKVSQARVFIDAGIRDVLVANEVVGEAKIAALIDLTRRAKITVAFDDAENLKTLSSAAAAANVTLDVLLDVDVGMGRCGVPWHDAQALVLLAQLASELPAVHFKGLMGYEGHAQMLPPKLKSSESAAVGARLGAARNAIESAGLPVELCSGAGSGNYWLATKHAQTQEIQAGGGVLFCRQYQQTYMSEDAPQHRPALFLLCQLVSIAGLQCNRAMGDAGFKSSFPLGGGLPKVLSHDTLEVVGLNAEHTQFRYHPERAQADSRPVALGEKILMSPFYSDATTLLHRQIYAVRKGHLEEVWPLLDSIGWLQ